MNRGFMTPEKITACLPVTFRPWAEENRALITCVSHVMRSKKRSLSDAELWDVIAEAVSAEWAVAKQNLSEKDAALQEELHPDNAPLGLIGQGLDGYKIVELERAHSQSLVHFTVINEHLYQQPELRAVMDAAIHIQRTAERSLYQSQAAMQLTNEFALAMENNSEPRHHEKHLRKNTVAKTFSRFMRGLKEKRRLDQPAFLSSVRKNPE